MHSFELDSHGCVYSRRSASAARRRGEMAVRTSLGATRARLARQLPAESLVLAAFGTAAGLVLAQWGIRATIALVPHAIPRLAAATIDGSVLLFTTGSKHDQ